MKNPYLHCMYKHGDHAIRAMLQQPFQGLTDVEHADLLSEALQSIHNSLQRSFNEFSLEAKLQRFQIELAAAKSLVAECIGGYPPSKEKLQAVLEILLMWTPVEDKP